MVEEDLERLEIENRKEKIQDRDWQIATKTIGE